MAKKEKPRYNTCGTELSVNYIITKLLQCVDKLSSLNIPNTLDAALGPDEEITIHILKFLDRTKLYDPIEYKKKNCI